MALWKDGSSPSTADLESFESDIFNVATVEEIDLSRKLQLARDQVSTDLQEFLWREAKVNDAELRDVVVTEALRRWTTLTALGLIYRDAHFRQMSERYKGKWSEYERLTGQAREDLYHAGVGRVSRPISRPRPPYVNILPGTLTAGTYFVCVSTAGEGGVESEASETAVIASPVNFRAVVGVAGIDGSAVGWRLYAGTTEDALRLQNTQLLNAADTWELSSSLGTSGGLPTTGQKAEYFTRRRNLLSRG